MYSSLQNPLVSGYWSINEGGGIWLKKLLETALQSIFVCYFPSLFANRYQPTNIMTVSKFLKTFFPEDSDYQCNMDNK